MKLSRQDADLFFELMWSLQSFVNLRLRIIPDISTVDELQGLPTSEKTGVREALYDNIELIDAYLKENPQGFTDENLDIVRGWKKFQRGDFFIERLLKKHAIFIGGDRVYSVLALYDSFEDIFLYAQLPHYVRATLLPFKGRIIYDGMMRGYSVSFGGGVKRDLKETYMTAKQNGRIIESFDSQVQAKNLVKKRQPAKDWGPTLDELSLKAKKLRSSSGSPAVHSPAFSMLKATIEFAKLAVENPDDTERLWKTLKKIERAMGKTETVLYRTD